MKQTGTAAKTDGPQLTTRKQQQKHENTSPVPQTAAGSAKRKGKENKKHPSVLAQTLAATWKQNIEKTFTWIHHRIAKYRRQTELKNISSYNRTAT
jgi:hypothetical protein